jgi:hypothetical protein
MWEAILFWLAKTVAEILIGIMAFVLLTVVFMIYIWWMKRKYDKA